MLRNNIDFTDTNRINRSTTRKGNIKRTVKFIFKNTKTSIVTVDITFYEELNLS